MLLRLCMDTSLTSAESRTHPSQALGRHQRSCSYQPFFAWSRATSDIASQATAVRPTMAFVMVQRIEVSVWFLNES